MYLITLTFHVSRRLMSAPLTEAVLSEAGEHKILFHRLFSMRQVSAFHGVRNTTEYLLIHPKSSSAGVENNPSGVKDFAYTKHIGVYPQ